MKKIFARILISCQEPPDRPAPAGVDSTSLPGPTDSLNWLALAQSSRIYLHSAQVFYSLTLEHCSSGAQRPLNARARLWKGANMTVTGGRPRATADAVSTAIDVTGLRKSFGDHVVLDGIDL